MKRKIFNTTDTQPSETHKYKASFIEKFTNKKNGKLLDIGCWTGQLKKSLKKETTYYGIDIDKAVVDYMKSKHGQRYIKKGTATNIPFQPKTFDVVAFLDVIEHIPPGTEKRAIRQIHKVLKKNGLLVLTTPADNFKSIMLDPAYFMIQHRHYKKSYLLKILKENGFSDIKCRSVGGYSHAISHLFDLFFKHIFKKDPPKKLSQKLKKISERNLKKNKPGFLSWYIAARKK